MDEFPDLSDELVCHMRNIQRRLIRRTCRLMITSRKDDQDDETEAIDETLDLLKASRLIIAQPEIRPSSHTSTFYIQMNGEDGRYILEKTYTDAWTIVEDMRKYKSRANLLKFRALTTEDRLLYCGTKRDFITELPQHVALKILKKLDCPSLVDCCLASLEWMEVIKSCEKLRTKIENFLMKNIPS